MESAITMAAAAFGLSLTYNLVPGPVTVEALRRGTQNGVRSAVSVRLGSLSGSLMWAVAGIMGAGMLTRGPYVHVVLSVAGTAVLLLLAARALRPAKRTTGPGHDAGARHADVLAGALISLASPLEMAFWLGVSGVLVGGSAADRLAVTSAFLGGFIAADLLFTAVFGVLVGWGRGIGGWRLTQAAQLLSIGSLTWFAVSPLLSGVR
jgi:L-lysine exporter family protein LysE/ArgO